MKGLSDINISQNFLDVFLQSENYSFIAMKDTFFDLMGLEGVCYSVDNKSKYTFSADIAKRINDKLSEMQTLTLNIPATKLKYYYKQAKNIHQFFAVIFALLNDFKEWQINTILSKEYINGGFELLYFFLCNPNATAVNNNLLSQYTGLYHIYDKDEKIVSTAYLKENYFVNSVSNKTEYFI